MGRDDRFRRRFILDQWWVAAMPGIAILIVSLGFNLLGDGLRDALDHGVTTNEAASDR
jgi:ABC-type dipeptide/oligopeptide/nickel transport system permease subunit